MNSLPTPVTLRRSGLPGILAVCGGVAAMAAAAPATPGGGLSESTRVPIRGEYVPPETHGPVSLTTELIPSEAVTPLMPEGAEGAPDVAESIIDAKRQWTFSIEARSIYDDNIFLSSEATKKRDLVFLLTPSVTWRHGDTAARKGSYATAAYSPSASFFTDESSENSIDHTFRFDGQKRFGRLAAGAEVRYQRLSGATPELSDRVDRDEAGGRLRMSYDIGGRTGIEASAGYNTVRYREAALADYDEWIADTYVGYQFSGRTRVAAGVAVGRMDVDGREQQKFQRALVKVTTDPTGKLTLEGRGGVEFRQTGAGETTTPVFHVSAEYRPTARTSVAASAYREVTASASVENENLTRTGASVRVQQKLGSRLTASVEAGYEKMEYASTEAGVAGSGREDEYFFVRPSLRYEFREGRRAEVYYSFREDDSTNDRFDFEANQAGLAIGFDF